MFEVTMSIFEKLMSVSAISNPQVLVISEGKDYERFVLCFGGIVLGYSVGDKRDVVYSCECFRKPHNTEVIRSLLHANN